VPVTRFSRLIQNRLFRTGLLFFVCGSGPLLTIIAASKLGLMVDPNPNPICFGILAMFTFWPSLAMMGVAAWKTFRSKGSGDG